MDNEAKQNVLNKLTEIETLLSEYENRIGLKIEYEEPNLNITKEDIACMSAEAIDLLRWEYARYSLVLQKEINKQNCRYYWADTNLKRYTEQNCDQYNGWKWEERMSKVINNDVYAQKLHDLKLKSKLVIERTNFLCNKIGFLENVARDIRNAKRGSRSE